MAITTYDGLTAAVAGSKTGSIYKAGAATTTDGAGSCSDYLFVNNGFPGTGTAPTSLVGVQCTNATAGMIPFDNPSGAATKYLAAVSAQSNTTCLAMLYDRLWHNGGIVPTTLTAQSFTGSAAIPARDANGTANGAGVRAFLEFYGAADSTNGATTASVSYTNQDGVGGRTGTITIGATVDTYTLIPMSLQAGDTGVRSLESITLAATLTDGTWGMVLMRPVATLQLIANVATTVGWDIVGTKLFPDTALQLAVVNSSTTLPTIWLDAKLIEG